MNKVENPFILTDYISPEYFCDREEETKSLISALRNGRNITLRSPRRIGKTGLIKNAFYYDILVSRHSERRAKSWIGF